MSQSPERPAPLFYRQPEVLTPAAHGDVRLIDGDFVFAAQTNATPLAVVEFAAAVRHYPVVFSEGDGFPIAVLGLRQGNRFVVEGRWAEDVYVPAYVRRYPFVFIEAGDGRLALGVDMAAERLTREAGQGQPLFLDDKPTPLTDGVMNFCTEFHGAHQQTLAFATALKAQDLLVPQKADGKLASGEPMSLTGFTVIDRERFAALDEAVVVDWHRKGWLALVHFHLMSLDRFADLLGREGKTPV